MDAEATPIARPRASRGLEVTSKGTPKDGLLDIIDPYNSISAAVDGSLYIAP